MTFAYKCNETDTVQSKQSEGKIASSYVYNILKIVLTVVH